MDLLNPKGPPKNIREDPETNEVFVEDLVIVPLETLDQALILINAGMNSRAMGK